ncbi:MAG TPA: NAD-dependent epimerase/dehydratase family protein [Candidatus Eremiobacteraceae bacterium]|nr:NAD-dependent epimerase/dehydratase family protein [Candidatus Eremiobacteraceae bacterium]
MHELNPRGTILIAGGGGFIGGWMAQEALKRGFAYVRNVDIKPFEEWYQVHSDADNLILDLRNPDDCRRALRGVDYVINLAADMGGMGYIEAHRARCMISVLINTNLLCTAKDLGISRYFYASSACVYNVDKQRDADVTPLKEEDAYPAMPEDGYGWEKLFSERMCRHFYEDFGVQTRVARYHNVYGPHGTWQGGREKAPAAVCRKVAAAKLSGKHEIEIWGDGGQTRTFMYIDDCVFGTLMLTASDFAQPINIGSDELVTVNQLVDIAESIAGIKLQRRYILDAPKGVRGRSSDNTLIRKTFNWEPKISLREGLEKTYRWIYDQMIAGKELPAAAKA